MNMDLYRIMENLSTIRPIFHSEADFQHALAWQIHHDSQDCSMRLEFKPSNVNNRLYIDIWATQQTSNLAIELKYKTRGLTTKCQGEDFNLLDQSAQDIGRYDFIKDVSRLEQVVLATGATAYAIFLTNDSAYWKLPINENTVDACFRIHQGKNLSGICSWDKRASKGTTNQREQEIKIYGKYLCNWQDYSIVDGSSYNKFRYLLLRIQP